MAAAPAASMQTTRLLRYVLALLVLCVIVRVALFDLAHDVLYARYVNGKRCEHVSPVHVDGAYFNATACFSRTDIQQILVGLVWTIHDTFTRHELPYWFDSGTLLGAQRGQTVIPYDLDGDIGIDAATFATLRDGQWDFPSDYDLHVAGGKFHMSGLRDAGIPGRLVHKRSGFYVDMFVFHNDNATAAGADPLFGPVPSVCWNRCHHCRKVRKSVYAFTISKRWVYPLQSCMFGGRLVNCPAQPDKYLEYLYGPDYMKPDK